VGEREDADVLSPCAHAASLRSWEWLSRVGNAVTAGLRSWEREDGGGHLPCARDVGLRGSGGCGGHLESGLGGVVRV
jgi:hypothetical protein